VKAPKRILVVVQPFESHLRALYAVINAVTALGHDVRVAAASNLASIVENTYGFSSLTAGTNWPGSPAAAQRLAAALMESNESFLRLLLTEYLSGPQVVLTARMLLEKARNWKPDVVISDITDFGSGIAAEKWGVPQLRFDNGWAEIFSDKAELLRSALAPRRAALGLAEFPADSGPATIFTPAPRGLLLPESLPSTTLVHYRHENPRRIGSALPPWVKDIPFGPPVVFVSLGSILTESRAFLPIVEPIFSTLIGALRGIKCTAIVSVGSLLYRTLHQPRDSNVHVVPRFPQVEGMPMFDLVITAAGAGTLREATEAGKRILLWPVCSDHFLNAARYEANFLARMINPTADDWLVRRMIAAALVEYSPATTYNIRYWQRQALALRPIGKILPAYI
jgi:UDP:flavonoid glycosyltransferase YjiC (YdhE family)